MVDVTRESNVQDPNKLLAYWFYKQSFSAMATPKKPEKKKTAAKSVGVKKTEKAVDLKAKKRFVDDDDDDEFEGSFDDLDYGNLESFDEDDDY